MRFRVRHLLQLSQAESSQWSRHCPLVRNPAAAAAHQFNTSSLPAWVNQSNTSSSLPAGLTKCEQEVK